jgi:sulfur carrier protein
LFFDFLNQNRETELGVLAIPTPRFGLAVARTLGRLRRSAEMKLLINGEDRSFDGPLSLQGLVEQLGMKADRVAVELNRDLVPRAQWPATTLADGDQLEIVHFVGGGS